MRCRPSGHGIGVGWIVNTRSAYVMSLTLFRFLAVGWLVLLTACATAPERRRGGIEPDNRLTVVANDRHRVIEQFVAKEEVSRSTQFGLPIVTVSAGASGAGISDSQSALVANNAGRALCSRLATYVELVDTADDETVEPRMELTAIVPTGRVAAGASSVIGIFIPGPFRLPAGLGGLAGDAELRGADGSQLAHMRWARGANPVTNSEKLSSIGDAWQLAKKFGDEFARAILDADTRVSGIQHPKASESVRSSNRALCDQRFGQANLAGRGASLLLPLSPESIDPGQPAPAEAVDPG